ncbi:MAG: hypothetical protein A2289_00160 [Deltaproteobacteria bacterium RIFOXYA12_FULL_58_15]|nr:MAG: hypothetical protein A2289_00160 [Deltaproteobacteria bacterium RIFOXYA12_FULL_58_15]OGR08905.1 MAG: hypothetical protein A2341_27775 [Deltaproteobacteria bacterium RIFOXYB12_FULL_58_9]
MPKRIRIAAEAEEELRSAIAWYNERRPKLGDELYAEAVDALDRLRETPVGAVPAHGSTAVPAPGSTAKDPVWRVFLKRFPYSVVYMVKGEEIQVIAFAHFKRRPGYWRK